MNRKIFLAVFITLLSLLSMFSSVVGTHGDIGAATISTFEWGPIEGRRPSVVRLGTSEFYLIAASNQTNPATWNTANITLWTIRVWNDNGTIKQSVIDIYKLDTFQRLAPELCHVYGDIYGVAYYTGDYRKIVTVKVWSSNGTIQKSWIDSVTISASFAGSLYGAFFKLSGNMFVCSGPRAGAVGGTIDTIYIDNNGIMPATRNDTVTFEPTTTGGVSAVALDSNTVAIVYYNYTDNDGWMQTWNITPATGDISASRTDIWEFDNIRGSQGFIHPIAGNVYAISYRDTDSDGQIKTLTIAPTGVITKAWIDTLEWGPADTIFYSSIFTVNPSSVYGVGYQDASSDGWIKTMNISAGGTIGNAIIDSLEFDGANCQWYPRVVYVNKSYYLIVYPGTDTLAGTLYDGWACTVSITTNYATPTLTNPDPPDGSTGESLTPILAITAADLNADAMTLTWSSNSSGSWIQFGVNTSVANGTYRQHNNNFSAYNTKYWWRINITDGLNTDFEIFSFATRANNGPVFSNENPANNSINQDITMLLWNITIEDPDGDLFNWTIECEGWTIANDNYDSAVGENNGSKEVHLGWKPGFPLEYDTTYTIWVNATDGIATTENWYLFTTKSPDFVITLSAEFPGNNSIVIYELDFGELPPTNMFNMSINRSHSGGLDMNTTIWFEGSLLFTNLTWGNGSIAFDLFDYWPGSLVNGSVYNWTVNASDAYTYSNETYSFVFTINVTGGAGAAGSVILFGDSKQSMWIGLCFIFFLTGTLILRSAAKKALKKK